MSAFLAIAERAARAAGDYLLRASGRLEDIRVEEKGPNDFVSTVDREAERRIIEAIRGRYPDHAILAEESGESGDHEVCWVIDPLDGTTNFLHGLPWYAVSIGVLRNGRPECGVIYAPATNELFSGARGKGARLNNQRLRVAGRKGLKGALLATGFPIRQVAHLDEYLQTLGEVIGQSSGVRRAGSAALDLAYTAAGRFDGFWEVGLKPWDLAAGVLLVEEAGGMVSDFAGGQGYLQSGNVVASNRFLFRTLLSLVGKRMPESLRR